MSMSAQLKAAFTDEEREAAAALGTTTGGSLEDKVKELFRTLGDPLLSSTDAAALLVSDDEGAIGQAMQKLVEAGVLEASKGTQRPLDEGDVELFRLTDVTFQRLKLTALETRLPSAEQSIFQWTGDGRIIRSLARVSRLDAISGTGQQRNEIRKHVDRIAGGIEKGAQVPNSILLVFINEFVSFHDGGDGEEVPESFIRVKPLSEFITSTIPGSEGDQSLQQVRVVEIDFPYRRAAFDEEKVTLLVDGQQRTAGLSLVSVDVVPQFNFPVNAVIANEDEAKEIFTLANQTVKIATDFERALLASMADAPPYLRSERVPAQVSQILVLKDADSPFHGIVRYPGIKPDKKQVIAYNTLFLIAHEFWKNTNLLDEASRQDAEKVAMVLKRSFTLVRATWPEAWGLRPGDSKLMHGAGLRSIASLVFEVLDRLEGAGADLTTDDPWDQLKEQLAVLKQRVVWRQVDADSGPQSVKKFFENYVRDRQNTSQDIAELTKKLKGELKDALKHQPVA